MIAAGQHLGGYTVQRRIGGGQMGEVFLAQHRRIARRAAIKALIPELSAKEALIERFFKQARNTSLVTHPGIVEVLDCDVHEGQAYVVMEFLHGESLGTYLKRVGNLQGDLAFLLGMIAQVAGAVGAAHDAGIMHRGLKPENVFLHLGPPPATAVAIKVLDFGVAQLSRDDGGPSRTTRGVLLGAPAYFSPEQCRGTSRTDERSDIYSLGCVFYEALCGKTPFVSRSAAELITAQVTEVPKPPIKLVTDLPPKLNALIVKMLAKSPDERPRTMSEVVESLRACARAMGIDFEGALEPVVPVERPDYIYAAAPAAAAPAIVAPAIVAPASLAPAMERPAVLPPAATPSPRPSPAPPVPEPAPPRAAAAAPPPAPETPAPPAARTPEAAAAPVPLAELMAAAARSAPGALAFPQRTPGQFPRTKILGEDDDAPPARSPASAPPRPSGRDPVAHLNALVGETIALPSPANSLPTGRAKVDSKAPARAEPPSSYVAEPSTPAGLIGGTQMLPPGKVSMRWAAEEGEGSYAAEPTVRHAPSGPVAFDAKTQLLSAAARIADFWRARPWLVIGLTAAGVVLCVALAATLPFGRRSPPATGPAAPGAATEGAVRDPGRPPAPSSPRAREVPAPSPRPSAAVGSAAARPVQPEGADVVRIEFRGIPVGTKVTLDGRPAPLPVVVPRGGGTHRLTLRTPDGLEQAVEVDGTKDRVIDWYVPAGAETGARKAPPPPKAAAPAAAPGAAASPKPRPASGRGKDLEAITDL